MTTIKFRRGTAAEWSAANPVLAAGEPGFETDTGRHKIGNGTARWAALPHFAEVQDVSRAVGPVTARLDTELHQRLRGVPDGPVPDPPTGQTVRTLGLPSGNAPRVVRGRLSSTFEPSSGSAAWYVQSRLGDTVCRLGARWTMSGSSSGTMGLIMWADDYGAHQDPATPPDSICHLAISRSRWDYHVIDKSGTFTLVGVGGFSPSLSSAASTVFTAEVVIDRENGVAYVQLPDGTTATVTHPLIRTLESSWAVVEDYRGDASAARVEVLEWWADSRHPGVAIASARDRARQTGAWVQLPLANDWTAYDDEKIHVPGIQWRQEGVGGRIRGMVKGGSLTVGDRLTTVPVPPVYSTIFSVVSDDGPATLELRGSQAGDYAGELCYLSGGNSRLTIDLTYPLG